MAKFQILAFYKFQPLTESDIQSISEKLQNISDRFSSRGLVILGHEGINSTMSVLQESAELYIQALETELPFGKFDFKKSEAEFHPFHEFKIKVRPEIVTISRPDLVPTDKKRHLTPEEWHQALDEDDVVVIDTRNSYEYDIGHFKGAIDPHIRQFTQFTDWVKASGIPKDKKVLIYCTGGIRCEKGILEMEELGYDNCFQLDGGILRYMEQYPEGHWNGECFVFDYRVAVDKNLEPSKTYKLCPHCGQPAKTKLDCIQCGIHTVVCDKCVAEGGDANRTCSKNCAHHFRMGHTSKRVHWDALKKRMLYAADLAQPAKSNSGGKPKSIRRLSPAITDSDDAGKPSTNS